MADLVLDLSAGSNIFRVNSGGVTDQNSGVLSSIYSGVTKGLSWKL